MKVSVFRQSDAWNEMVDRSPYSVLHHRYELCGSSDNSLPLLIREQDHCFLVPLSVVKLLRSFRLATCPIIYYASILPDAENSVDLLQNALDCLSAFLLEMRVDYLSLCAPTFWSKRYSALMRSWFKKHNATVQVIYAYMIPTKNSTFEQIAKDRFRRRVREQIRKVERNGVSVIKIDTEDGIYKWINDIYRCNVSALMRQGRWGAYPDSYKDVFLSELVSTKRLLKNFFNLYGTVYQGQLIAYMTVHEYNKLLAPSKALSRTEFLKMSPNDVLFAHLVKEACQKGFHWIEYGWDRVSMDQKIPSFYAGIQVWRRKFGFNEVPIPIYRLGLTRRGRVIQRIISSRDYMTVRSALLPAPILKIATKLYTPRRRKLATYLDV